MVVQSPMLYIPDEVVYVPVKRCTHEEHNTICFLPRADFEPDSSKIYGNMKVSQEPSFIDAHGIAVADNDLYDTFEYERGDRFWLFIGPNADKFQDSVPVINLRTFQRGILPIAHACWYPKIKGPKEELWTPCGEPDRETFWGEEVSSLVLGNLPETRFNPALHQMG